MQKQVTLHDLTFEEYIPEQALKEKLAIVARKINSDYQDKNPLLVGLLNGCFMFASDLVRLLEIPHGITFTKVSSYNGLESSGNLEVEVPLKERIKGRHVIIVEDIVDTGFTLSQVLKEWKLEEPASIEIVSCLIKPDAIQHKVNVKYYCFAIPNTFVVGYGLDYDGLGRGLKSVYKQKK